VRNEIETKRNETKSTKRNETKRNQRKRNETKRNQRNGNEMKQNKNMTFELLKVCRQANPAWIELRVMYVRSIVTDRHARWVIINQNYCI
jgi:hypothetical protein